MKPAPPVTRDLTGRGLMGDRGEDDPLNLEIDDGTAVSITMPAKSSVGCSTLSNPTVPGD
jgi:hypothetical protein